MRVRKQRDAPARGKQPLDQGLRPRLNFLDALALRYRRSPHRPVRIFSADVLRLAAFVDTVVPFAQARLFFCLTTETRLGASVAGTAHRAAQHQIERLGCEHGPQRTGLCTAMLRQRNVSAARVLAGLAPFGFTMTDQPDLGLVHLDFGSSSVHWRW